MTTPHRTLQMALDALDAITDDVDGTGLNTMPSFDKAIDAIAALREALAQPEPEPVAWRRYSRTTGWQYEDGITSFAADPSAEPLYASHPTPIWEQLRKIGKAHIDGFGGNLDEAFEPAAPADMVMVPREPTHEMLYAMAELDGWRKGDRDHPMFTRWRDYWNAALAAAPAPAPAECCRNELLTALHTLASNYENALGMFGQDGEGRRKAEGDLAHAMKVAAKHNRNGPGCAAPAPAVPSEAALNTLARLFHNGEEIEGDDGAAMMVDLSLWHEASEAFDSLIGDGDGETLASSAAPAVREPQDERAAFEAWIRKDSGDLTTFGSGSNMHYRNSAVNNAWTGWQARAHGIGGGGK